VTTIRTTSIVSQQQRQRLAQNFMREQMNNYKQMRRQHHRQLQQVTFVFGGTFSLTQSINQVTFAE